MSEQMKTIPPMMTTGCPHVYQAIHQVMAALSKEGIAKTRHNTQGAGYDFRGVDDVLNAVSRHLVDAQLVILPRAQSRESVERQTKAGGALFYTTLKMEYDFISAVDGSMYTCSMFGEAMDTSDKSTNKAASAAYKYTCFQGFCIPLEGESNGDADEKSHEVKGKKSEKSLSKEPVKQADEALRALNTREQTWTGRIIRKEEIPGKDGAYFKLFIDDGNWMYTKSTKLVEDMEALAEVEPVLNFQVREHPRRKNTWELVNFDAMGVKSNASVEEDAL
jgi:hypothetical protein